MTSALPWFDAERVFSTVGFPAAIDALERALTEGHDPAADPARSIVPVQHGQLLLMPSEVAGVAGVKLASVAPGNPAQGLPRIQALYVVLDSATLTPRALLDGTALTTLRTPALSAVAARHLAPDGPAHLLVFGSGPQAWGHVHAIAAVRDLDEVVIAGRSAVRAEALARGLRDEGFTARSGGAADVTTASIIVCATTAATPVFDGAAAASDALVIAVGSHEPSLRELDGRLVGRSQLVVEDPATALREAGDVIMAIAEGRTSEAHLVPLASIVRGEASVDRTRPRVFKSVGMGWEDLVVAAACLDAG